MGNVLDFFLHLDDHLKQVIVQFGPWTYGILFLIVFCETGLVFMPFLPGDSLLFTAGVIANQHAGLNVWVIYFTFIGAALCGDNVNYVIGRYFGHRLFNRPKSKIFKQENLAKTHEFMEKHGHKAIVIARFVPFIRTFVPFVAGMGEMGYRKFLVWSILGAFIWVTVCVMAGYLFGGLPIVKENFATVIYLLIGFTLIPLVLEIYRHKAKSKKAAKKASKVAAPIESGEEA
jgi:membrane-associated protein